MFGKPVQIIGNWNYIHKKIFDIDQSFYPNNWERPCIIKDILSKLDIDFIQNKIPVF